MISKTYLSIYLWKIYNGYYEFKDGTTEHNRIGPATWNTLIKRILDNFTANKDKNSPNSSPRDDLNNIFLLANSMNKPGTSQSNYVKREIYIPSYGYNVASLILSILRNEELVNSKSHIQMNVNGSHKLVLISNLWNDRGMEKILEFLKDPDNYVDERYISTYYLFNNDTFYLKLSIIPKKNLKINLDDLSSWVRKNVENLIKTLVHKGFLIEDKNTYRFSSHRIAQLLTNEGIMLEIYTFYKLLDAHYFDEILSSYEVINPSKLYKLDIENEFDLILTKGYRSYFIECKGKRLLERKDIFKLNGLVKPYGINELGILVHYSLETKQGFSKKNKDLYEYGENFGLEIISKPEDFSEIDEEIKLLDFINQLN